MATKSYFKHDDIKKNSKCFSQIRAVIETSFYGNNVISLNSRKEAYKLACKSPGTIVTGMKVYKPELQGLNDDTRTLIFNDGAVTGRTAAARRIVGQKGVDVSYYGKLLQEAIYQSRFKKMYHSEAFVGLDSSFIVKAHVLIPENYENLNYSWLLNFQYKDEEHEKIYADSKQYDDGDIYVFADPDWHNEDFPYGLVFFDQEHNCGAILGMRYFGEFKKGTLTLAWAMANRHNYACCHAGQKRYYRDDDSSFVAGMFGLSGSGKSTLTHARHDDKYKISVLHDDAFIISVDDGSSVALEPAYFDKTQDYPSNHVDNKFLLTVQNNAATLDENGEIWIVPEDIRNGNGRAVKSRLWTENREDKFDEPLNAIFWIMKDPTLPPILKVNNPILASVLGATLATKRNSAERLVDGVDPDALVFEPYANPFRVYKLEDDYLKFKKLFEDSGVSCYILNTGAFLEKDISKDITISALELAVDNAVGFKQWENLEDFEIFEYAGYVPDFKDENYVKRFYNRMNDRLEFLKSLDDKNDGFDKLPEEAKTAISNIIEKIQL